MGLIQTLVSHLMEKIIRVRRMEFVVTAHHSGQDLMSMGQRHRLFNESVIFPYDFDSNNSLLRLFASFEEDCLVWGL